VRALWLALGFLTRLPVPHVELRPGDLAGAARLWPLAGVVVGACVLAGQLFGAWCATPLVGAALGVAAGALASGGLHLDALCDSFDGLGVVGDRERRLAAMRDSRAGSLGAAAVALWVVLKVALLHACAEAGTSLLAVVAAPVVARALAVLDARTEPPATPNGLFAALSAEVRWVHVGVAIVLGVALSALPLLVAPHAALRLALAWGASAAVGSAWARGWRARVGGSTGDVLGAGIELREGVVLLLLAG
jgi:adenosylcobinamide-GDP ribazoletransferase